MGSQSWRLWADGGVEALAEVVVALVFAAGWQLVVHELWQHALERAGFSLLALVTPRIGYNIGHKAT